MSLRAGRDEKLSIVTIAHPFAARDGFMAGKPLNRLELRRQSDAAEPLDPMEDESEELVEEADDEETDRKVKKKAKPAPKSKAKAAKPIKPPTRLRNVWTVLEHPFK